MKGWIIGLAIVFAVFKLIQCALANYIRNDKDEKVKYVVFQGSTTLGLLHGLFSVLSTLVGVAEAILLLVYFL